MPSAASSEWWLLLSRRFTFKATVETIFIILISIFIPLLGCKLTVMFLCYSHFPKLSAAKKPPTSKREREVKKTDGNNKREYTLFGFNRGIRSHWGSDVKLHLFQICMVVLLKTSLAVSTIWWKKGQNDKMGTFPFLFYSCIYSYIRIYLQSQHVIHGSHDN